MDILLHILLVGLPFLCVVALSPFVVRFCQQRGLVADLDARRLHASPTPHGGGIVIIGTVVPLVLGLLFFLSFPFSSFLTALFVMSLPLAALGWVDDHRHISPLLRLFLHLVIVAITVGFLPQLFDIVPLWVEKIILILAWVWFLNLYNFMDGLDGLTTSEAVFLCVSLLIFAPQFGLLVAVLGGACLGFLRVNWHPARIFIGDVGSTWLGFIFAGLFFLALEWDSWRLVYPLFTVTLVFSGDATYTLFKCIAEGHKPWIPHRKFWFHRAWLAGLSHDAVVLRVLALNLCLLGVAYTGFVLDAGFWTLLAGLAVMGVAARRIQLLEKRKGIKHNG